MTRLAQAQAGAAKAPRPPRRWRIDAASTCMVASAASMATMGALVHQLGSRADWLVVALVRSSVMAVSAALMVWASGHRLAIFRPRTLWVRSVAGSFSLVCNFYALSHLMVADAVTLSNVHPLWIVFITALAARKWPRMSEAVGVASGLVGVILIERPQLGGDRAAVAVALLSSVSTSVAMLGLHRLRSIDNRAVVAHFAAVASLVAATWLALRWDGLAPTSRDPTTIAMLAGVGLLGTVGQILLTKAYSAGAPARVAVVGLTQVVFALGFDMALLGRVLDPATVLGFALVLAPTTWLSVRSAKNRQAPAEDPTMPEISPVAPPLGLAEVVADDPPGARRAVPQ